MGRSIRTKEYQDFAERLKKARIEAGFTQVEAAKKLKLPQSYISKVEAGEQRLDVVAVLEMWLRTLHVRNSVV